MALNASTQWYVRAGGATANGAGFDSTITGAGTNYADQDSAQVVFSSGNANRLNAAQNALIVTSDGTPFTSAMVGNVIRISGGTNFIAGYYIIIAYTSSSQVTFDRAPCTAGAGSVGVGNLGGAQPHMQFLSTGGSGSGIFAVPSPTTPIIAGNTVNIRGAGSDDAVTADYDWSAGYWTLPFGDSTNGRIALIGYNGRPFIKTSALLLYHIDHWYFENLKLQAQSATNAGNGGIINTSSAGSVFRNLRVDANGFDIEGLSGARYIDLYMYNSGSTSVGTDTRAAILINAFNTVVSGCYITNWRGSGIYTGASAMLTAVNTIIKSCKVKGVSFGSISTAYNQNLINCTIDGCTGDGVSVSTALGSIQVFAMNCIMSNNGGYGLNEAVGSAAVNDRITRGVLDYNDYYNDSSGARQNLSAGAHDQTLDPQYVNASGGNYAIGTNLKADGFPASFRGSSTTSYVDIGAVQRIEPTGGVYAGGPFIFAAS